MPLELTSQPEIALDADNPVTVGKKSDGDMCTPEEAAGKSLCSC